MYLLIFFFFVFFFYSLFHFTVFVAGLFLLLVFFFFFFFFSSSTLHCFLLFFLFFPRWSVPLIVDGLFLFLFLFTSFNSSIFLCLSSFTVTRFVLNPWRTLLAHAPNRTMLYTHLPYHNDSIIKTHAERRTNKGRMKASLTTYLPLTLFVRFQKGCSRFACEWVLETEHKLHILTPLLWPSRCLSCSSNVGVYSIRGFSRAPSVGCGFPCHIWSLAVLNSTGNCSGTRTQLS